MADPTSLLDSSTTVQPAAAAELAAEQRFAVVPEWMLDAEVSDAAFRLYAVLARYGNTSGVRMPGRALLASRLRKSVDTVDRALRELTAAGVLEIERRQDGNRHLTNRYHLRTIDPESSGRVDAATPRPEPQVSDPSGRTTAATHDLDQLTGSADGRGAAATPRRTAAAGVAALVRPDPDVPTETSPPTPAASVSTERVEENPNRKLLDACGIPDLAAYAAEVQRLRREMGQPSVRWSGPCLSAALQLAVKVRGWPASAARQALLLVAADTRTRSPMRLAEAGPWWDHAEKQTLQRTAQEQAELDGLERLLADCDDRAHVQHEGPPATRRRRPTHHPAHRRPTSRTAPRRPDTTPTRTSSARPERADEPAPGSRREPAKRVNGKRDPRHGPCNHRAANVLTGDRGQEPSGLAAAAPQCRAGSGVLVRHPTMPMVVLQLSNDCGQNVGFLEFLYCEGDGRI